MNKELSLEELQCASFNVLLKIKEIFEENNWDFYLAYGTLIGAIRHNGFIPWDDDIDIWIPREYYESFIDYCIANEEKIAPFKILSFKNVNNYQLPIARFTDTRYTVDYPGLVEHGLGLFVDLYPLDRVNPNDVKFKNRVNKMYKHISMFSKSKNKIKNLIKSIYQRYILFKYNVKNVTQLCNKLDNEAQKYNNSSYDYITVTCCEYYYQPHKIEDFYSSEKKYFKFNQIDMPVPYDFNKVLNVYYKNYMTLPPIEEQIGHHEYRAFKKNK